ncbi:MAG: NADH-quinone oxidoreductase subunit C [Deltaproteobacteria bacterium]|nr:NADH-quinone oxidoreductase subunit C [Deltaproteobacteria bacterium]
MEPKTIFEVLKGRFGGAVLELQEAARPSFVVVAPASALEIAGFLHDDSALSFDSLMCLSGVDYKDRFAVVWHLYSMSLRHTVGVKIFLPKEKPEMPSVDPVWPAANFMERETYDLFGIVFTGSKDLRRILLPEDWEGHPLRKDYKYPESYHGVKV